MFAVRPAEVLVTNLRFSGAAGAAYSVYNTLDLKSIQLDTLSYVCSRHVAAQGQLAAAQLVFNTVLKFFNNVKDVSCGGRGEGEQSWSFDR